MVMKRNAMGKNLRRSIWKSLGRYLAIVAIIALGASMFVGLLMTKSDMIATGQRFMDEHNMFDLRLVSPYGWDPEDVEKIAQMDSVDQAEGLVYLDLVAQLGEEDSAVYRFYAMPKELNTFALVAGRMPENANECLLDGYHITEEILGTQVEILLSNEEASLDSVRSRKFTVVGFFNSPLYMDLNRGSTTVGNGTLANCFYVLPEVLQLDYLPEIHVTLEGEYPIYSQEYKNAASAAADTLEPLVQPLAQERMEYYREQAQNAYDEGMAQYEDGLRQYEEGKLELEKQLAEAEQQLVDGEKQLAASESQLYQAQQELEAGEKEYEEGLAQYNRMKDTLYGPLDASQQEAESQREEAAQKVAEATQRVEDLNAQIDAITATIAQEDAQLNALNEQIASLDSQIVSLEWNIRTTEGELALARLLPTLNRDLIARLEVRLAENQAQLSALTAQRQPLVEQRDTIQASIADPLAQRQALMDQRREAQQELNRAQAQVDAQDWVLQTVAGSRELLDSQFADTQAQLEAAKQQIEDGKKQLAAGRAALQQGKKDIEDGWIELEKGRTEGQQELADAWTELEKARQQLDEAKTILESMTEAQVFILDRSSNVGYNSLSSSSDIVSGVSRVLPAFFLLVAALVCITTMTRMIDEERTQIGTLKALGYSNFRIINKYLLYAGSGAVIGCGMGVILGSIAFPTILWEAYGILLYISQDLVLKFNWWLIGTVVGTYTAVMLLVTWYSCRRSLQEQPAELIRPKAPDAGKKLLMERLPLWKRISFLNKVTIRNIFRYRQRLAMMLVGIGGCVALLVAAFGLRDSIVNVVDYQFEEVTTYDMTVYFTDGQTPEEQEDFLADLEDVAEKAAFYHQSSMDIVKEDQTRTINLVAGGQEITQFINLHSGKENVTMPGKNQVVLSAGISQALDIQVGDSIVLRNSQIQELKLTVSGIYDNHVENYAIIVPQTMEEQLDEEVPMQMAFVNGLDTIDIRDLTGQITVMSDVMNVAVSQDFADMVSTMMEAMDLVVIVVAVCAAALAVIVLYNLTNININERIREIATIKVLGFNARETAMYIFKENLTLTVIGSIAGLGMGYALLLFVMDQIHIDMVWFKALVTPQSYIVSVVLTILSAVIVDFVFYFKLDKINMAEALKSVE